MHTMMTLNGAGPQNRTGPPTDSMSGLETSGLGNVAAGRYNFIDKTFGAGLGALATT